MTDENTDELGDFDEFQNDDEQDDDQNDAALEGESNAHAGAVNAQLREARDETDLDDLDGVDDPRLGDVPEDVADRLVELQQENAELRDRADPLGGDFQIGDPAVDLANGRTVVIVDRVADRTDDHSEAEGYDFAENYGNSRLRTNAADPVFEAVYVNSLSSKPSKSYDFPSSRLGRPEYENVTGVDRVYEMVARDVLDKLFQTAKADGERIDGNDAEVVLANLARWSDVDVDVDEAEELARAEVEFGGSDE